MVVSVGELNREFTRRALAVGLEIDCLADGDVNSDLMIVSEAPGYREKEMKLPLVGASGKFLWDVLGKFGIRRQHCYITNVVKKQLVDSPQTGGTKVGISRNELAHWRALLRWEMEQLPNVKYVLVLGSMALEALCDEKGIDAWRGSVLNDGTRSYIIANNPAFLLRKPSLEPVFHLDISKLDMVRRGQWRAFDIKEHINPSPLEAIRWCDKMIQEDAPVSFDIETMGGETACVGFANQAHEGMCINFREREDNRWPVADERRVRTAIQRVLRHGRVRLVAQNGGFDCGWMGYKDRIAAKPLYIDTLLAHHTLHPTWPHNLGFLTAQYTTHPFYKDEKDAWREGGDIDGYWRYNVKDACITWEVARRLEAELKQQKLWDFFQTHVMALQPWLIEATVLGNRVDLLMREKLNQEYGADVDRMAREFRELARIAADDPELDVNPLSPKQLGALFFQKLRLVGKSTSTDEENRNAMIESPRTPDAARKMLIKLNDFKEQHKLFSTYIKAEVDPDGRMRSDYKQYGTQFVPGRLSSSQTLWGSGMNLQNQPERLRGMFVCDADASPTGRHRGASDMPMPIVKSQPVAPGDELCYVYFDGAQAEARIVAYEANIPKWKEQFERARLNPGSYDAHIALASEMFGVPIERISKDDYYNENTVDNGESIHTGRTIGELTMRGKAKRCRHGLNYRMQAARLAVTLSNDKWTCPLPLAETLYGDYHRATPELKTWWNAIIEEVRSTRTLFTCLGRRMEFLGSRIDEELIDSIIAFKPQSTLGDFVTGVQRRVRVDPDWPMYARVPFNNHDSLTAMCRMRDSETVGRIFLKHAEAPLLIKGEQLIIPADLKRSVPDEWGIHRWSNLKKFKV